MTLTIKEIADRTNTSTATVSRVINNPEKVAKETREKVLSVLRETDFTQNKLARGLVRGKSQILSLITPLDENVFNAYYFQKIMFGINRGAADRGYNILIDQKLREKNSPFGGEIPVDGYILVSPSIDDPVVKEMKSRNVPLVLVSRRTENNNWVDIDNVCAMIEIVDYLFKKGHRDIGILAGGKNVQNSMERLKGCRIGFNKKGIRFSEDYVFYCDFSEEIAFNKTMQLLSTINHPTAIVAFNDLMAIGCIRAIKYKGLNVPQDIAVTGFDDIDIASYVEPSLTTYKQPFFDMGREAVKILIDQIEGKDKVKRNAEFIGNLIIRNSSE